MSETAERRIMKITKLVLVNIYIQKGIVFFICVNYFEEEFPIILNQSLLYVLKNRKWHKCEILTYITTIMAITTKVKFQWPPSAYFHGVYVSQKTKSRWLHGMDIEYYTRY